MALVSVIVFLVAGSACWAQTPSDSARATFARYEAYTRNFDPRVADLYAPDAVIVINRGGETRKFSRDVWRQLIQSGMSLAKARGDLDTFTDVTTGRLPDGLVEVRATRINHLKHYNSPYRAVLRRSGDRWLIVREEVQLQ
jgi:ketosteroid isomerase-like protein